MSLAALQDLLHKLKLDASDIQSLRVVLRVVRTIVRNFYRQLKQKCGVFIGMAGFNNTHLLLLGFYLAPPVFT